MNNDLEIFIKNNECDYTRNIINLEVLKLAEQTIGIKFGNQLSEYLLKYGYLGYKSVELYGMNANQGLNSNLFEQTMYLHNSFEVTKPYIVIDKIEDNIYTLIDSNDNIYICELINNKIRNINIKLNDYIIRRFESEKNGRKE